jgi:carboxymethylenebutenolidase
MRGNDGAKRTPVSAFDADARATLDYLAHHPQVAPNQLATMGFCIGGHLAMRAALDPRVKASVCCYPTGVHNGKLGKDPDAGTLQRLGEMKADLLVVFGSVDPHVPATGRAAIADALKKSNVRHTILELPGEHAFMRDEGARYDPAVADLVYNEAISLFHRIFPPLAA